MAPDQRYCLSCGTRRGEPRVPLDEASQGSPAAAAATPPAEPPPSRQADVSPLAAVIGIALLGGMLLIGVLIGRGANDEPAPAPVVQVGESTSSQITSEWPSGTDGYTVQLSTIGKADATQQSVDDAIQSAVGQGAADAAVLDSDLYDSLPPGNYVIYSGVFTDRKSAEVAQKGLQSSFSSATVVEVSGGGSDSSSTSPPATTTTPESEALPPEGDTTAPVVPGDEK